MRYTQSIQTVKNIVYYIVKVRIYRVIKETLYYSFYVFESFVILNTFKSLC